ncbi:MAG TPA: phage tail sheath C-terminal domain-containing protein [Actinomycetota bacterium]|jgi:phage tail sheath protein FI|nr:phage tail sheath C-terminal domain-containing protein [Actinomycetota bacterium]
MPVTPTYPGVYIEEIPSGVRPITGVSTSVTAFVGFFPRGPIDTAVRLSSIGDFEREFGGLHPGDETGYAIQQFFLNGGATAWVVRVASSDPRAARVTLQNASDPPGESVLEAFAGRQIRGVSVEDPGEWGNNLHIGVDYVTRDPTDTNLFNLTVSEVASVEGRRVVLRSEVFANCSTEAASSDFVVSKVNDASKMIQLMALSGLAGEDETLRRPAQTGTMGAPVSATATFDDTTFDAAPILIDRELGTDIAQYSVNPDLPTTGLTFGADAAQIRSALEQGIRTVGRAEGDLYLSGARVTIQGGALHVAAGGETGAGFDPETILRFSASQQLNLDDGTNGVTSNVQQYRLGTGPIPAEPPPPPRFVGHQQSGPPGDGGDLPDEAALTGSFDAKTGIYALRDVDLLNILVLPRAAQLQGNAPAAVYAEAQAFCEAERAFLIVDVPPAFDEVQEVIDWVDAANIRHRNAAVYFPRIRVPDPLNGNRLRDVGPSGTMAGIYARTDGQRGVWKAPAGVEAVLRNVLDLGVKLSDADNGVLNPVAVNALRQFPVYGRVSWGARTLEGADARASEWKYVPVRRFALFLEESLYRGLQWVVFEPNDEPLWAQIRLNVGAFLHNLFRLGAFQGASPRDAYFVKCDAETTIQNDIDLGIVNIIVGFAPLKPAEFVIIKIQQIAGQSQT